MFYNLGSLRQLTWVQGSCLKHWHQDRQQIRAVGSLREHLRVLSTQPAHWEHSISPPHSTCVCSNRKGSGTTWTTAETPDSLTRDKPGKHQKPYVLRSVTSSAESLICWVTGITASLPDSGDKDLTVAAACYQLGHLQINTWNLIISLDSFIYHYSLCMIHVWVQGMCHSDVCVEDNFHVSPSVSSRDWTQLVRLKQQDLHALNLSSNPSSLDPCFLSICNEVL